MRRSEQINEVTEALCNAQAEMPAATKDSTNKHFGSKYADFASAWGASIPSLTKHGIAVTQTGVKIDGEWILETTLLHKKSGQFLGGDYPIIVGPQAQAFKSGHTYARRGGLESSVGIASEDDDGNEAQKGTPQQVAKPVQQQPLQAPRPITTPVQRLQPTSIPNRAPGVPNNFGPRPESTVK